jgi:hypothetical protein
VKRGKTPFDLSNMRLGYRKGEIRVLGTFFTLIFYFSLSS